MVNIPATIVTTIGAIQPLVVLFCERLVDVFIGKISRDHLLARKLIPISLIALGVALIYSQEILKML
jgi:hypothetical protein